jgi:uncharacterized protein YndB with AHSA1/START domain
MRFTNTIWIDRPQNEVFAFLADLENLPRWNYAIRETRKITPGPVEVGTRYHQIRTVPAPSEETLEVAELEVGHRLTVVGTLNELPARLSYVLAPAGASTALTNDVELTVSGALTLVAPLAARRIKAAVSANLDVLREILERSR